MSIFTRAFNKLGYGRLAERFPGADEPVGRRWDRTCVQFGSMRYDWCVTVIVAEHGLWLQARPPLQGVQPAILVPWGEIRGADATLFFWRRAVRLTCGAPAAGTITVWRPVWGAAAPWWQAARGAPSSPAAPPGSVAPT